MDAKRISIANQVRAAALKQFRDDMMANKISWCLVSVPTVAWARKVFPKLSEPEQMEKLWAAVFMANRIHSSNPIDEWRKHIDNLQQKIEYLNQSKFKKLFYRSEGTDLTIELPNGHRWCGGGTKTQNGISFMPNMPTEEVFTLPLRQGVNGVVTSTKPLYYSGKLIENLSIKFAAGRIVDVQADTELETLVDLIDTDDGAHYLGEVALVPHHSPISNLNLIFANTLFDENASCHLAIGAAYPICLENGTKLTQEQLHARGVNNSLVHVDFMIGSANLDIDGECPDGTVVPLFRNGNWVN